jgi:citrate lyase subunit beta/citryl-CoA lyase
MIPKVESLADVQAVDQALNALGGAASKLPIHVLLESARAVHHAFAIASHPRLQSISFGLMDFVSSHNGAIGSKAMGSSGQFTHPLVLRAKLEIASACHAHGKVPSHCVVTEFNDGAAMQRAAERAAQELGYTRMWSIHPNQIRPILAAFAPQAAELEAATVIIAAAQAADWAPISHQGVLHDRASYRYYWQLLERGHRTGAQLPQAARIWFE